METLKRPVPLLSDERGITGLETAIVLIAFIVVASVFAFAILTTGMIASQKTREAVEESLSEAGAAIVLRGSIIANKTSGASTVESIVFQVANANQKGAAVDLARSGNNATLVSYLDGSQFVNLTSDDWLATWIIGSGDLLNPGERAEIRITLSGLAAPLGGGGRFTLHVKPTFGSILSIQRTIPSELTTIVNLD